MNDSDSLSDFTSLLPAPPTQANLPCGPSVCVHYTSPESVVRDFLGCLMVKNLLASAGDAGSIPLIQR